MCEGGGKGSGWVLGCEGGGGGGYMYINCC